MNKETWEEAKAILHEANTKPTLPCPDPVAVPAMITHYSNWDYFCMGSRRALKTAIYVGAASAAVAGIGVMFGAPILLAFEGAGLMVGAGSIAMGAAKIKEESAKAKGETPLTEKIICFVVTLIVALIKALQKKKGG
jgi:hypothetical protein